MPPVQESYCENLTLHHDPHSGGQFGKKITFNITWVLTMVFLAIACFIVVVCFLFFVGWFLFLFLAGRGMRISFFSSCAPTDTRRQKVLWINLWFKWLPHRQSELYLCLWFLHCHLRALCNSQAQEWELTQQTARKGIISGLTCLHTTSVAGKWWLPCHYGNLWSILIAHCMVQRKPLSKELSWQLHLNDLKPQCYHLSTKQTIENITILQIWTPTYLLSIL